MKHMHICSVENFMNFSFNKKKPQWKLQKCLKSAECPMWQNDVAIILMKQKKNGFRCYSPTPSAPNMCVHGHSPLAKYVFT